MEVAALLLICCCPCLFVFILGSIGLGIAEIVMGAIHLHNCARESMIPIYLIVSGVFSFLFSGSSGRRNQSDDSDDSNSCLGYICRAVISAFTLGWFIAGHVWVFGIKDDFNPNANATDPRYCNNDLYLFAYWSIIAKWIIFGVIISLFVFLTCCAGRCTSN